ncbi:MAG: SDR family NAD(P)-dependent oxidoreductase [Solirubrobacteraceae bacterium]
MPDPSNVVLVTGSSSGIGAAIAREFARNGATVVVNSRSAVAEGRALADEIGGVYEQADVSDAAEARDLVERAVTRLGRLDVVVNNAGTTAVIEHDDLDAATPEVWRRILDVNLLGAWSVITAAVPHLRAAGGGSIVNVSSTSGSRPTGSSIPYAVSKAAVNHMTLLLAAALGPTVRVNAIAPGLIDTRWTADWQAARENVEQHVALRRAGRPDEIAHVCVQLAMSTYATGAVVPVDGGLSLQ